MGLEEVASMTTDEVEAAAKVLNPYAFGPRYKIGCDSPWHYEAHSISSSCPAGFRCSNPTKFAGREYLDKKQQEDQEYARERARKVIRAVEGVRNRKRAKQLLMST